MTISESLISKEKSPIPNIMLVVVNKSGLPVFQYPIAPHLTLRNSEVDDTLFSGLIHAITAFAKDIVGEEINNLTFGKSFLSLMRGNNDLIFAYVLKDVPSNAIILKQLHIETMAIFYQKLTNLTMINTPIDGCNDYKYKEHEEVINQINSIMYPLFKFWEKRIYLNE